MKSIDMVLRCPACGLQHIDAPDRGWTNPPHRSHLCAGCKYIWRPADVPTNGVAAVKTRGKDDSPAPAVPLNAQLVELRRAEKEVSDAYLRIRALVGAWGTKPGGSDRFEITEAAVLRLVAPRG